ncbi:hypothetical protein [Streptomyces calidiresistens]|uniref:Uncharacterized protein n=1 Tax=Streptomyces calidiresistens TaxID=1485586 RepID=A0A7W3T8W3_9ACTN|nr:hypothetical protein [Streptomyces calidiresistens]MBB0233099.1 hypothetical protein [Streptomyces calidiresistens]
MIAFGRRAVRVYRAADRIVARPGEPTAFEVFLARRPLLVAVGAGAPLSALFAATALLCDLREVHLTTWLMQRVDGGGGDRVAAAEFARRVASMRAGPARRDWSSL